MPDAEFGKHELSEIRRRAEEVAAQRQDQQPLPPPDQLPGLVHELQVHQIALEMQNEALREARAQLEASRDRYADLYDFAPVGFVTLDERGIVREINLTACALLGGQRSRLQGHRLLRHIVQRDRTSFLEYFRRCRSADVGRELEAELWFVSDDHAEVPVRVCTIPDSHAVSNEREYRMALFELTELRRGESVQRHLDRQLSDTLESITDAFVACNREWRYTYVNPRACQLLGKSRDELIGSVLWDVFPEARETVFYETFQRAMQQRTMTAAEAEYRPLAKWFSCRCYPAPDGVSIYFLDITDRKETELQLQELTRTLERQVKERTGALAMLRDIASMANRAQDVEEALTYCLRRVAEYNGWSFGHAYLPSADDADLLLPAYVWYAEDADRYELFRQLTADTTFRRGEGLPGRVYDEGQPRWSTDIPGELPVRRQLAEQLGLSTVAAFPILVEEHVVGVLEFFSASVIEPAEQLLESMASVGTQLGRVIERTFLQRRLLTLAEDEQRRIGQELHDDVGQELTGASLKAETLAESPAVQQTPARELARQIVEAVDRTRRKVKALSRGLVPMELEAAGLGPALEQLAAQLNEAGPVTCRVRCQGPGVTDGQVATQLFRIAQEAVANAVRHSGARHVHIRLRSTEAGTELRVSDDGEGFRAVGKPPRGAGMQIMRYRAGLIGGTLRIESAPGGGTRVICEVRGRPT